jgi:hypothetical protein
MIEQEKIGKAVRYERCCAEDDCRRYLSIEVTNIRHSFYPVLKAHEPNLHSLSDAQGHLRGVLIVFTTEQPALVFLRA